MKNIHLIFCRFFTRSLLCEFFFFLFLLICLFSSCSLLVVWGLVIACMEEQLGIESSLYLVNYSTVANAILVTVQVATVHI